MFTKELLSNGVRIVSEKIENVRSLSIGIWVGTGSRNELSDNNGISHFIEHMMFKGTQNRTAKDIAEEIDNIGGQINAFTAKEATCYYTKTLDSHYEKAINILSDIYFNSTFSEENINTEKGVILEEIGMYQDSLEDLAHDILSEAVWSNNPLGYPILGTSSSLNNISREKILNYYNQNYVANNTVISVAGSFNYDEILDSLKRHFEGFNRTSSSIGNINKPDFKCETILKERQSEQTHLCMALDGIEYGCDELYSLLVVNNIFGGSMSSRLFQNIREKRGLTYSVYSFPSSYSGAGLFTIYAGLNPSNTKDVIRLILEEINLLKQKRLTDEEIAKSKEQLKGNYILGLEGTSNRMTSIGKAEVLLGKILSPDEILQKIDRINKDSVNNIIEKVFDTSKLGLSVVGKIDSSIDFNSIIKENC